MPIRHIAYLIVFIMVCASCYAIGDLGFFMGTCGLFMGMASMISVSRAMPELRVAMQSTSIIVPPHMTEYGKDLPINAPLLYRDHYRYVDFTHVLGDQIDAARYEHWLKPDTITIQPYCRALLLMHNGHSFVGTWNPKTEQWLLAAPMGHTIVVEHNAVTGWKPVETEAEYKKRMGR